MAGDTILMNLDCDVASVAFLGVRGSQGEGAWESSSTGVGVRGATSSLDTTLIASKGTSPVPRKPPCMFFSVKES